MINFKEDSVKEFDSKFDNREIYQIFQLLLKICSSPNSLFPQLLLIGEQRRNETREEGKKKREREREKEKKINVPPTPKNYYYHVNVFSPLTARWSGTVIWSIYLLIAVLRSIAPLKV